MNLNNYFYCFPSAIPSKLCDEITQHGLSFGEQIATTAKQGVNRDVVNNPLNNKEIEDLKQIRDSNVVWLNEPWIYKEIHPYIHLANKKAGWNFEWDWSENCQFTKYKLNQYYDWHCDSNYFTYQDNKNQNTYGKIRKLSLTCQLTDGNEYEGGELEFDTRSYDPREKKIISCKDILPKGSIVVFPSFVWHRVKPVTKGIRHSLVMWNLGYPFK